MDADTDAGVGEEEEVVVPRNQVKIFLETLKKYSDSCSATKKTVLEAARQVDERAESMEASTSRLKDEFNNGEAVLKSINYMRKFMQDEAAQMRGKLVEVDAVLRYTA